VKSHNSSKKSICYIALWEIKWCFSISTITCHICSCSIWRYSFGAESV